MQTPYTLIFVGRSGAGKGTQLDLLKKYLAEKDPSTPIGTLDMGSIYRAFFGGTGYVQEIARDLSMGQGKFQPDFLTSALFVSNAITFIDGRSHIVMDGFPRSIAQLETVKDLLAYTKRTHPVVINIDVSRENVKQRMLLRGRGDDSNDKIDSRLDEYDRAVVPMLEAIKVDPTLTYVEVSGEGSIESIHQDLIAKLGL